MSQSAIEIARTAEIARNAARFLIPEFVLLATAMAIMTASAFTRQSRKVWCAIAAAAMLLALGNVLTQGSIKTEAYGSVVLNDHLSGSARIVLLLTGLVILGLAHEEPSDERAGELFGALLVINAGAMITAAANEIVLLFVGLELVSIPTYLILYLSRRHAASREAAVKYFFLSLFASSLLLYGLGFLYGTTGLSNLKAIGYLLERLPGAPQPQLGLLAIVFILAGLTFRVAAVPLHFYAPDVYQGSPIVIAALLSWLPKAVGILAMARVLTGVFATKDPTDPLLQKAVILCWVIAAATMVWGNFVALLQTNLKLFLAYSSIAHAGYLMVGITAAFATDSRPGSLFAGTESALFYLVAYAAMTLGVFGILSAVLADGRGVETIDDLAGLGWARPWTGLGLAVCLLSLAGIPPLAGFWAKFEVFTAAISATRRDGSGIFLLLAVVGMLSAAAGAFYYLRLVVIMYLVDAPSKTAFTLRGGWPVLGSAAACVVATVGLGLFSSTVVEAARLAAQAALSRPAPPVAVADGDLAPRQFVRVAGD